MMNSKTGIMITAYATPDAVNSPSFANLVSISITTFFQVLYIDLSAKEKSVVISMSEGRRPKKKE